MSISKYAVIAGLGAGLLGAGAYSGARIGSGSAMAAPAEDPKTPVHDALKDLRRARTLLESVHSKDVNDHRKQALDGINLAIDQLEMAVGERPDKKK